MVNLTAPTLTLPGIKAHDPYSIVDKPITGLVYLNSKEEKRVMYLAEIVKLCDAMLERVLNEVKLKIFKSEPWKKPPLVGELDRDILNAYEREITKRLRHRVQIRSVGISYQTSSIRTPVGIKILLKVTAVQLVLLVQKLLLLVLKVNAAGIKVTTAERLQLLK
ncbi:hypothetical protein Tco_0375131 [Tanacetum coccineum]